MVVVVCRHPSWVGLLLLLPPSFGSLYGTSGTLKASPQGGFFQVSSSIESSGLAFEGHGSSAIGTYLLPLGTIQGTNIGLYIFWESHGQPWPTTPKRAFPVMYWVFFVRGSLALGGLALLVSVR